MIDIILLWFKFKFVWYVQIKYILRVKLFIFLYFVLYIDWPQKKWYLNAQYNIEDIFYFLICLVSANKVYIRSWGEVLDFSYLVRYILAFSKTILDSPLTYFVWEMSWYYYWFSGYLCVTWLKYLTWINFFINLDHM